MIAVGSSVQHSCPSVFPVSVQARSLISKQGKVGLVLIGAIFRPRKFESTEGAKMAL